jgi:hypothetical protein
MAGVALATPADERRESSPVPTWRARAVTVVVALAAGTTGGAARATADGPDHFRVRGVSSSGALNLREAPSAEARVLARIPAGESCLRNLGCRGGLSFNEFTTLSPPERARREAQHPRWCKVEYRGIAGWAAGRYLAEGSCP